MKYLFGILVAAYALLSMAAAATQLRSSPKRKDTSVLMMCGGLLLVISVVLLLFRWNFDWLAAAVGGAVICLSAFINGKRSEAFHLNHHVIRLIITLLIVVGFILM